MKYARRAGLQVALVCVPGYEPTHELLAHCTGGAGFSPRYPVALNPSP